MTRRWMLAMGTAAVVFTGAGFGAARFIQSPAQAAAEREAPPPTVVTAKVESRVLTSSIVLRGTVAAGRTVSVTADGIGGQDGRPIVSRLPVPEGGTVRQGRVLAEVSGRPVIALQGDVPLYRDLRPGAHGKDVAELQDALERVGHSARPDARGHYGEGTKAAVTALYAAVGHDPLPATGEEGGKVLRTARDQVITAGWGVDDARHALAKAEGDDLALRTALARAEATLRTAEQDYADVRAADGPLVPAGEIAMIAAFPARVQDLSVSVGDEAQGPLLTVASGALVVRGYLPDHQKDLVRKGQSVEILSEATGDTVAALVRSVAETRSTPPAADEEQESTGTTDGNDGYPVVVAPGRALSSTWAGQNVRLTVEAATTARKVLVVPVSAVSADAGGSTVVTTVDSVGARPRRVPVRVGASGDGYVQVTAERGARLKAGDEVVTGSRSDGGA